MQQSCEVVGQVEECMTEAQLREIICAVTRNSMPVVSTGLSMERQKLYNAVIMLSTLGFIGQCTCIGEPGSSAHHMRDRNSGCLWGMAGALANVIRTHLQQDMHGIHLASEDQTGSLSVYGMKCAERNINHVIPLSLDMIPKLCYSCGQYFIRDHLVLVSVISQHTALF